MTTTSATRAVAGGPRPSAPDVKSFADFGVAPEIVDALADQGITAPFPIQELTLPLALSGADLIGQARTGTGKTLAFGIPLLQRVDPSARTTQALVIVPTRELCLQVRGDLADAGARRDVEVVAAYGGKAIDPQSEAIAAGAQIVVGTPGRLLDLVRRGVLHLETVTALVLDEADEMLDLGFLPDVEQLIEATASQRQTLLFSATMPSAVVALARRYMHKPTFLRAEVEEPRIAPATQQYFFSCHRMDKPAVLARILQTPDRGLCVVFTRTKRMADILAEELRERGVAAAPIHSDLRQDARERTLGKFRKGTIDVLVATEVAARGLDISDVTHVVNYDCPDDEKMYLHRIGRTGRAGAAGVAITFAVWNELARMEVIKKALDITEPTHEVFSTSPILDELFDLPERQSRRRVAEPVASDDEDDGDGREAAPRSRSGRSRRRRRSRRGGGKPVREDAEPQGTEDRDDQEQAPQRRPAAAQAADDPEAEVRAPTGDDEPRRVRVRRRSSRSTSGASAEVAPEDVPAAVAERRRDAGDPDVEAASEGSEQRRVRTRTRTRSRAASGNGRSRPVAASEDEEAAAPDQDREDETADRGESAPAASARGGSASKTSSGRAASTRDTAGRDSRNRSGTGRGGGAGRGSSGRGSSGRGSSGRGSSGRGASGRSSGGGSSARGSSGRGSSGRSGRDRSARDRGRPSTRRSDPVDVAAARGGGKPALQRRMTIQHLP